MKLTDKMIRAATPGKKLSDDGEYGGGRLMLVVTATGTKVWKYRKQSNGKDTSKTLGHYPAMSLADAREAARSVAGNGLDRYATLEQLLAAYRDSLKGRPSFEEVRCSMQTNRHVLFNKQARDINAADIAAILRPIFDRGAKVRMNRFRSMLSAAYNWGAKRDNDPTQPAGAVHFGIVSNPATLVPKFADEKPRDRILADDELKAYVSGAKALNSALGDFILLQLYTGQRFIQLMDAVVGDGLIVVTDTKGRGGKIKINKLPILPEWAGIVERAMLATKLNIETLRKGSNALLPDDANALDLRRTIETRLLQLGISREDRVSC
jgi:integrase